MSISTTPVAGTGNLPVTGTDVASLVWVAAGLIALGATMRYGVRRRP
ncbi:LPXTG cell wall anchor domain-containing protein [Dactylosporangium vinaceum]|nr:LPXTG cell wall anchor domain-containing protein [Dactylosporangium vinaceum]UAB97702.1 LPXTG cell wall anchor domain-containing protein [Dactylosporangium vinaceum]